MAIENRPAPRKNAPSYSYHELASAEAARRIVQSPDVLEVPKRHRFVTIETKDGSVEANMARTIERQVFEKFFDNDAERMAAIYGSYEEASRFFLCIDTSKQVPAGALRVIENSPAGLLTLNVAAQPPFNIDMEYARTLHGIENPEQTWDVGTVAVLPEYRKGRRPVSIQLYRAMYLSAMEHNIDHLVSLLDTRVLETIRDKLGVPFQALGGSKPRPFEGSPATQAVYGYVPDFYPTMHEHRTRTLIGNTVLRDPLKRLVEGSEDDAIRLLDD
jgi:hypothetical protein